MVQNKRTIIIYSKDARHDIADIIFGKLGKLQKHKTQTLVHFTKMSLYEMKLGSAAVLEYRRKHISVTDLCRQSSPRGR